MKHLKTYESFGEPTNENLKSIVAGTLLTISSLISNDIKGQQDMFDPANPIGYTNPMSPNNPSGIMNPANPNSLYYMNDNNTGGDLYYTYYRDQMLKELSKIDIKDSTLIQIKNDLSKEDVLDVDVDKVTSELKQFCDNKGYSDLSSILGDVDDIDVDQLNGMDKSDIEPLKKHLLEITYNLHRMSNDINTYNIEKYICLSLLAICVVDLLALIVMMVRL